MSWMDKALCTQTDTESWFPVGKAKRAARVQNLVAMCGRCDVRRECAQQALDVGAAHGVWAGVDLGDGSLGDGLRRAEQHLRPITERPAAEPATPVDVETVLDQIAMLRDRGWTLTKIAREAGVSVSIVSRVAARKVIAAPATARAIMAVAPERVSANA